MNYNMNNEILKKIGLSDHEIKIYLTLLRLGTSTATKIASETNIDRATTYRFISLLIERGFVSYVITNNVKYFNAAHPNKLIEDQKEKLNQIKNLLPELENLISIPKEEAKIELYKGKEGLKTIMKDILREKKPYTFVGEVERFFTELPFYIDQWLREVEKSKIKGRLICNKDAKFKIAKTETYKLISSEFISRISTWTYSNKTALFIWSTPPFGIIIENKDVTESNLSLFEFLWKIGKSPLPKKEKAPEKIKRLKNKKTSYYYSN